MPAPTTIAKLAKATAAGWTRLKSSKAGGFVSATDNFLLAGSTATAYLGIKRGIDKLSGTAFDRPGAQISDPEATRHPFQYSSRREINPYIRPTSFIEDLNTSFNVLFKPDQSGLPSKAHTILFAPSAAVASGTGITAGLMALAAARRPGISVGIGLAAGLTSGIATFKLAAGTIRAMGEVARTYYGVSRPTQDYRAYGGGAGYRTWYKSPGKRMHPGHMGADGTLPLAMHKIRNRSVRY